MKNKQFISTADVPKLFKGLKADKVESLIRVYVKLVDTDYFYTELIMQVAEENFSQALLLLNKINSETSQQEVLTNLALLEVKKSPELAVKVFDKVPVVDMKKFQEFSQLWFQQSPEAFCEWFFSWDIKTFFWD